jgi:ABC-type Mn2+/Zn2+ transport system ATPase subunit
MPKPSNKRSNNNYILEVKDLSVFYGDYQAVNNVSFELRAGEILAIIGPNGSGKSTLLKAILELVDYTGRVRILGKKPKLVLDDIGYVPQRFSFEKGFPLTVVEFLELSQKNSKDTQRRKQALKEVEMNKSENKLIGELSGGQLQRVLIARALLNDPKIIFLDEATSGIDAEGEKNFYEIIQHLNKVHGLTIVLISHELNMVYKFASQVVCLNRDLICFGQTKEAITNEVISKLYGNNMEIRHHTH